MHTGLAGQLWYTVYETVKVGEADGVLGTSTDEHGKNVYAAKIIHQLDSWEKINDSPTIYPTSYPAKSEAE